MNEWITAAKRRNKSSLISSTVNSCQYLNDVSFLLYLLGLLSSPHIVLPPILSSWKITYTWGKTCQTSHSLGRCTVGCEWKLPLTPCLWTRSSGRSPVALRFLCRYRQENILTSISPVFNSFSAADKKHPAVSELLWVNLKPRRRRKKWWRWSTLLIGRIKWNEDPLGSLAQFPSRLTTSCM